MKTRKGSEIAFSYIALLPAFIIVLLFALYPAFYAVYLSVFKSNFLIFNRHFVGLSNYITVLSDSQFWIALWKTFIYTFWCVILQFFFGFTLAIALNKNIFGRTFYRAAIVLPWTLSPVIVAIIATIIYEPSSGGLLNFILLKLHLIREPVSWLGSGSAMYAIIGANTWFGMAFTMVLELAGMQSIPTSLYEAARVDGASSLKVITKITLPLLKPTMLVNFVWITISTFNEFDLVYALTGGGPLQETNLLGIHMYNTAFKYGKFEIGSTIAVLMFVINALLTVVYSKLLKGTNELA
ncbi:binding-protein-dependent transport system inner membrane protein [[Clostridium] cellulosi]|uniref:Binding-protein-dependent transport system inner membrane protein n=1 Tax=[Clostridium] cellulosi TaxID=29343 RepID=A0A078KRE4_9FIRM|nr:binding-protein-dependent transport system inner membrane protein [[Clostridium] cellulosi]